MRRTELSLALSGLLWLIGCGDDGGGGNDGGEPADADLRPDAFNPCPGQLTFEAQVTDLASGQSAFDVELAEVGNAGNTARSAPNGRAVLCLPSSGTHQVRATHADYLPHLATVDAAAAALHRPAALPFPMLEPADADALIDGLGVGGREPAATQLLIDVRAYPGGTPLGGASVAIAATNDGAFVRDASDQFVAGATLGDDSTVLFANVSVGGATTMATVTPGTGSCSGPSAVSLEASGGLSSAFFACE